MFLLQVWLGSKAAAAAAAVAVAGSTEKGRLHCALLPVVFHFGFPTEHGTKERGEKAQARSET